MVNVFSYTCDGNDVVLPAQLDVGRSGQANDLRQEAEEEKEKEAQVMTTDYVPSVVCGECMIWQHRNCAGLVEVGGQPEFCGCAVCKDRLNLAAARLPGAVRESQERSKP